MSLSHVDRAVALLWYYRHTQEFEERSASALATDLHDEGFPKPNVTRLADDLRRSQHTVRGKRPGTFQIDVRRIAALDDIYLPLLGTRKVTVTGAVLASEALVGTRGYLEQLAQSDKRRIRQRLLRRVCGLVSPTNGDAHHRGLCAPWSPSRDTAEWRI